MKRIKYLTMPLLAALFTACSNNSDVCPDTTAGSVEFSSGQIHSRSGVWTDEDGEGNLIFGWTTTDGKYERLAATFIDTEGNIVETRPSNTSGQKNKFYTYNTITPSATDSHYATFRTYEWYDVDSWQNYTILAVTPIAFEGNGADITKSSATAFQATMPMPSAFTQTASKNPTFLQNYMYMYGYTKVTEATLANTSVNFKHIPATFRFLINNTSGAAITVNSISVSAGDGAALCASSYTVDTDFVNRTLVSTPSATGNYQTVTTTLGKNGTELAADGSYIAYALALPLAEEIAELTFTLKVGGKDYQVKSVYNKTLVSGSSYTIQNLNFDGLKLSVGNITVADWDDNGEINGEATQTPNN